MTLQYGTTLRTAQVAAINATISPSAAGSLKIFSGAQPANCATADPAGLLCTITLPVTFLTSSAGATTLAGTWSATASGTGTAACFRNYDSSAVCHMQGNVTSDLVLNNTSIASGQAVSVTAFGITAGNA
jgi:hypothetical protein